MTANKYKFDTVRWLRNVAEIQSHRAGAGAAMTRENMLRCSEEIERLREIISEATSAIGNGSGCSAQASVEFMAGLPKEIAMNTDALRARVARLEDALKEISTLYWIDAPAPEEMRRIARRALEEK